MPYVKFICVKCGYTSRCEVKLYAREFNCRPNQPLCLIGLVDDNGNDGSEFEYIECRLDEV